MLGVSPHPSLRRATSSRNNINSMTDLNVELRWMKHIFQEKYNYIFCALRRRLGIDFRLRKLR